MYLAHGRSKILSIFHTDNKEFIMHRELKFNAKLLFGGGRSRIDAGEAERVVVSAKSCCCLVSHDAQCSEGQAKGAQPS